MTGQLDLYPTRQRRHQLIICHPSKPGGALMLRVALDAETEAYWEVVDRPGRLGLGKLLARMRRAAGETVIADGETLVSTSEAVRREWARRLTEAGWQVTEGKEMT